uniref:Uncharacterized protein n=1 Tax=Anguilla anguilla TaxID=7936 RepID=A0A0E9T3N9_ANGAN
MASKTLCLFLPVKSLVIVIR